MNKKNFVYKKGCNDEPFSCQVSLQPYIEILILVNYFFLLVLVALVVLQAFLVVLLAGFAPFLIAA